MANDVILMVADSGYFDHAKYVLVNCRKEGGWTGDFSIISPESSDASDFARRGIDVLSVPDAQWSFLTKFWAFTEHYHRWNRALCVDLDIMVQGSLQKVFDGLSPRLPNILCDLEDGDTIGALRYFDPKRDEHGEIYARLQDRYPHVSGKRMFNAAFIFYEPRSMPATTREDLLAVHEEFREINPTNADQMIMNMVLYNRVVEAGKDYFCFFGFDYPENRIPSEFRGWLGNEVPSILHYTNSMAPWHVKYICHSPAPNTQPGGYQNHRLGRISHELYAERLSQFDEVFPA